MSVALHHTASRTWLLVHLGIVPIPRPGTCSPGWSRHAPPGACRTTSSCSWSTPPVFTLGRRGGRENLLVPEETLRQSGIPIVQVERGGNITYHGPGQLVVYPIVHLPSFGIGVVDMVDRLEEVMIRTCAEWGIRAGRNALNRGVWVGLKKIGAIGIAVRRGVSFHGMALNVNIDLTPFGWIQPCGLKGVGVTSIAQDAGRPVRVEEAVGVAVRHIEAVFGIRLEPQAAEELAKKACS